MGTPTSQPDVPFSSGTQWFNESTDTLYTAIQPDTWVDALTETVQTSKPDSPLNGEKWFNETTNRLYIYNSNKTANAKVRALYYKEGDNVISGFGTIPGANESDATWGFKRR